MDYNYHTHTYVCHHASGTPEEYVLRAIECGVKYMGFAEHFPLRFDNGDESCFRIYTTDVPEYFSILRDLADKYSD